ncbi:MAG: tetratricopeptide repeat protein [Cyanobacteria bacterium J069]|nr:MAG: tetratricopeptide repeat protein [Cyanobacteria bacterium J069]
MPTLDPIAEDQRQYERLIVSLELSQGKLDLLIAVCDDRNLQEQIIQQYIQELQQQGIEHYRVLIRRSDPSLRHALEQLLAEQPSLKAGDPAVVTVQGIDDLLSVRVLAAPAEQERFLGYLQWTREAFRQFQFPVVLWMPSPLVVLLAQQAPDFWSWRGGVFWFGLRSEALRPVEPVARSGQQAVGQVDATLAELLQLIETLEQQPDPDAAQLLALYDRLGEYYARRGDSGNSRQFAIQVYRRVVQLQKTLGLKRELAENLEKLGNLYSELRYNVPEALANYEQAIALYREVGDRLGEANTLQAIGDVLQFLKRSTDALANYEQAMGIYREVGARLGEANTLQAIGDVLQFLDRRTDALANYEQAIGIYREVGDRLGEANVLQEFGKLQEDSQAGLDHLQQAQDMFQQIGDQYSQSRNLLFLADRQVQLGAIGAAIESLKQSAALAQAISYEPLEQYALNQIAELEQRL